MRTSPGGEGPCAAYQIGERHVRTCDVLPLAPGRQANSIRDFWKKSERIGIHPFILVGVGARGPGFGPFVSCRTQNEAAGFVAELAALPRFAESLLLRGIERALQQEIYEAGDLFYRWTRSDGAVAETAHICRPDRQARRTPMYNYPVFVFDGANAPSGREGRTQTLLGILETTPAAKAMTRCGFPSSRRWRWRLAARSALPRNTTRRCQPSARAAGQALFNSLEGRQTHAAAQIGR